MRRKLWYRRLMRLIFVLRNNEGTCLVETSIGMLVLLPIAIFPLLESCMLACTSSAISTSRASAAEASSLSASRVRR